jgi:hypothetical protein
VISSAENSNKFQISFQIWLFKKLIHTYIQQFLFFGEISYAGETKKTLANSTKGFYRILKKENRHILRKKRKEKKLRVARFRQCIPVGCQN